MTFHCDQHPSLIVRDLDVRFVNGVAKVTDPKKAAELRKLPAELGIRESKADEPPPVATKAPARR